MRSMKTSAVLLLLLSMGVTGSTQPAKKKPVSTNGGLFLRLIYTGEQKPDTAVIKYFPEYYDHCETRDTLLRTANAVTIRYREVQHGGYVSISYPTKKKWPTRLYLIEPGDSVTIVAYGDHSTISGSGSARWRCKDSTDQHPYQAIWAMIKTRSFAERKLLEERALDSVLAVKLAVIDYYQNQIGKEAADILKLDAACERRELSLSLFRANWISPLKDSTRKQWLEYYRTYIADQRIYAGEPAALYSARYPAYLLLRERVTLLMHPALQGSPQGSPKNRFNELYRHLVAGTTGTDRSRVIIQAFTQVAYFEADSLRELLRDASRWIQTSLRSMLLSDLARTQSRGMPAFNFSLQDTRGKTVRLTDFKGKTLLLDFWFTGCSACRALQPWLKALEDSFRSNKNFVMISISVDKSKERWLNSAKEQTYSTPGAINLYTGGQGADHPLITYYRFTAFPRLMIIDRNGNLFDAKSPNPSTVGGIEAITRKIKEAINLRISNNLTM